MERHFKVLAIFFILSLIVIFSSCADDTGITIYGSETTPEAESTQISTEEITTETQAETEAITKAITETVPPVDTEAEPTFETITNPVQTTTIPEIELVPEETTVSPKTEEDTQKETAENIENDYKTEYLLNTNTKKFHHPSCKSGQKIKDTNRADYNGSRDEIIAKGYSPCKICNP